MLVVGLTGSIGMGKSTVAAMLRARGVPVFDADAEVHRLYAAEAVPLIEAAFPGTTADGKVDRLKLAAALAKDEHQFRALEKIVHPLVWKSEKEFLARIKGDGAGLAVLEIPLLLEVGTDARVDVVIVVSAPPDVQRARVLARPGMTDTRLDALLERQLPDIEKHRRAHFIVDTSVPLADTEAQVDKVLAELKAKPARAYDLYWR